MTVSKTVRQGSSPRSSAKLIKKPLFDTRAFLFRSILKLIYFDEYSLKILMNTLNV